MREAVAGSSLDAAAGLLSQLGGGVGGGSNEARLLLLERRLTGQPGELSNNGGTMAPQNLASGFDAVCDIHVGARAHAGGSGMMHGIAAEQQTGTSAAMELGGEDGEHPRAMADAAGGGAKSRKQVHCVCAYYAYEAPGWK